MKKSGNPTKNPRKAEDVSARVGDEAHADEAITSEGYPPESIEVLRGMPLVRREPWNMWLCIPDADE